MSPRALSLILLLVAAGCARPTFQDGVAAVRRDDAEALGRMLGKSPDLVRALGPDGHVLLHYAAGTGAARSAKVLLDAGSDVGAVVQKTGQTPLHVATTATVARVLLDEGAKVDAEDTGGWTPLRAAAFNGHVDVARLLLERGANVESLEKFVGLTVLHTAVRAQHAEVAKLLIEHGAKPLAPGHDGTTPLHDAARGGSVATLDVLIATATTVDVRRSTDGATPLHLAAARGDRTAIERLLRAGASRDAKNAAGKTPADLATPEARSLLAP